MILGRRSTFLGNIIDNLKDLSISKDEIAGKNEAAISRIIYTHLRKKGLRVANEKQIGFLKFVIDIDYEDGKAGIEVKLAESLILDGSGNSEIQRLFGQVYYYTKIYKNVIPVVLVIVVGDKSHENDVKMKELKKFIEDNMFAKFLYFPLK